VPQARATHGFNGPTATARSGHDDSRTEQRSLLLATRCSTPARVRGGERSELGRRDSSCATDMSAGTLRGSGSLRSPSSVPEKTVSMASRLPVNRSALSARGNATRPRAMKGSRRDSEQSPRTSTPRSPNLLAAGGVGVVPCAVQPPTRTDEARPWRPRAVDDLSRPARDTMRRSRRDGGI
jgi:hypothetical protein